MSGCPDGRREHLSMHRRDVRHVSVCLQQRDLRNHCGAHALQPLGQRNLGS
jgi:hypothetical protein